MVQGKPLSEREINEVLDKLDVIIPETLENASLKDKLKVEAKRTFVDEIAIIFSTIDDRRWFKVHIFADDTIWDDIRGRFGECINYNHIGEKAKELKLRNADVEDVKLFARELVKVMGKYGEIR